jgi:acetyltransferase-like isoleucine patch superfamily enzyme
MDSFAHIGHNDKIGKYVAMTSGTVLGGSVTIGDYCWIAQHVSVRDHIKVGKRVILGQGASVVSDIPDDAIAVGVPAKVIGQNIPFRRIP